VGASQRRTPTWSFPAAGPGGEDQHLVRERRVAQTALLGLEGLVALGAGAGCVLTLISIVGDHAVSTSRTISALAVILLLATAVAMHATLVWCLWRLGRQGGGSTIGLAHNAVGALGMLPVFLLLVLAAASADSPLLLDRIPDVGIVLFGGVMVFSLPGLGVYLSRGPADWWMVLGNILGVIVLQLGLACFAFLWICAAARFTA